MQKYDPKSKMESLFTKSLRIAAVVAAYWFVSITLVFVNKFLLSDKELKLDAPFFITWFQCVIAVVLCAILSVGAKLFPKLITFPEFKMDLKLSRQVLPLSLVFIAMISFNNLCLKHVGVSFYYVGRSLTTVFNVVCVYLILKQSTSKKAILCCGVIVGGFFLGVDQEGVAGSVSYTGVAFGVLASLSVALYSIYTKKVLPAVDENVWKLGLYNNLNACVLFLPLMVIFGEVPIIVNFPNLLSVHFWLMMSVGGIFGFLIGFVTGLQIQVTSPLTHNISGTAKACAQTVIASIYYIEQKPVLWWLSNVVVLAGTMAYTHVKRQEMKQANRLPEPAERPSGEKVGADNV